MDDCKSYKIILYPKSVEEYIINAKYPFIAKEKAVRQFCKIRNFSFEISEV